MTRHLVPGTLLLWLGFGVLSAWATVPWTAEQIQREFEAIQAAHQPPLADSEHRRGTSLDDPDYFYHYLLLCDFLASMQYASAGDNQGGMIEGESGSDHGIIETDNTQEAIRIWSRYAVWTGDTATYGSNIRLAKGYCGRHPAWRETDTDYYSIHNCGWGFEAVKLYRQAYTDTSWNWYADSCAWWMTGHILSVDTVGTSLGQINPLANGLGLGGMYPHALYRGRTDWQTFVLAKARLIRRWFERNPARLNNNEVWALSGGTALWGVCVSLFAEYPDSGQTWLSQYAPQLDLWQGTGSWNNSLNAWYCNAHYEVFNLLQDSTYWDNAIFITDSLLAQDTDNDGGIMPGNGYPNTNDHSWVSAYMGWMGMERVIDSAPAQDGSVIAFVSPDPSGPHLAQDSSVVSVRVANVGRTAISGRVTVSGQNGYLDSTDVSMSYGMDTVLTMTNRWFMPDDASLPDTSFLLAVFTSPNDENSQNNSVQTGFDLRHGVQIHGSIADAANPDVTLAATVDVYHEAYPDSIWESFEAPASGSYVSGPRPLMEGSNRIVVKPAIQYLQGESVVNVAWESSPQQVDFALGRTDLALVDDDVDQTYETWYQSSLDSFPSLHVRLWDRSSAPLGDLESVPTVLWFCGNDSISTLDTEDQSQLESYLNGGGNLLLTGQNITEDEAATPFLSTVLQCSPLTANTNVRAVNGTAGNPISDGVLLILMGLGGAWNQNSPASVTALPGSTEILHYTSGDNELCGVSGFHGNGRYIFLSFGLEAASSSSPTAWSRDEFLARCFAWFDSAEWAQEPLPIPLTISLAQNYPNPFNPSTVIRFLAPPDAAPVSLIVYNLLGQEVRTLYSGSGQIGAMSVAWDGLTNSGEAATSGMYVYRLRTARRRVFTSASVAALTLLRWLLEFRRRNPGQVWAWATYDFANSAYATTILAVIFNVYYARVVAGGAEGTVVFGTRIPGATMFTLFVSAAMIIVAVSSPFLAALSDVGGLKKRMLAYHLATGVVSTALLYTVGAGEWMWGGMLFLLGQIGFAGGNVFYNSMLHDISDPDDYGKVSGIGWAWGYLGGGLLLVVNLIMLQYPQLLGLPRDTFQVQDCFLTVAVWWVLFSIPIFRAVPESKAQVFRLRDQFAAAGRSLGSVLKRLRELPHFARFFFAFLLFNDGIETVIVMAAIFGDQELHLTSGSLILFFLMVQAVALIGSLIFGWLADRIGNRTSIIISLIGWLVVVVWGWQLGIFGNARFEYWLLGFVAGLVMGGSQAASRSLQANLIPPAKSAEFFSFFGISSRFASAIGPLMFGLAVFVTGSLRLGILSLIVFFAAGFALLLTVDEDEGHAQALRFETAGGVPHPETLA